MRSEADEHDQRKTLLNPDQPHGVWTKHARQWERVGPPCRPTDEDGHLLLHLATPSLNAHATAAEIVIMGVTPEVVQLPWPAHARLQAFDHSAAMIASVWRPHPKLPSKAQLVRWQAMPLPDHSVDCVVGDGSLTVLPRLQDYPEVLTELARVLKPDGSLVLRCFVRPDQPETLEEITEAALAGDIGSFHALKWRMAMALSTEPDFSVPVLNIWTAFNRYFPDRDHLAQLTGWQRESIDTIDAFDGVDSLATFPTLGALTGVCAPTFEVEELQRGRYELAECCPTIRFKPRVAK